MKKFYLMTIICLVTTGLFTPALSADLKLSENIEVYKGDANLKVTLARVLPLEKNQALMMISGIDHELSQLVLLYDVEENGEQRRFTTQLYGRSYYPFIESSRWGRKNHTLYLRGSKSGIDLYFDEKGSAEADAEALVKQHVQQAADGTLEKIQLFNRDKEVAEIMQSIMQTENEINEACPHDVKLSVDWDTISDEIIKEYSVSSYCGNAYDEIRRLCENEETQAWVQKEVNAVHCRFADKLRLRLDGKTLHFQTQPQGVNQNDFVRQNLINIM